MNDTPQTPHAPQPQPPAAAPPPPTTSPAPPQVVVQMPRRGVLGRIVGIAMLAVLLGSISLNVFLGGMVARGRVGPFELAVMKEGDAEQEVAVNVLMDEGELVRE